MRRFSSTGSSGARSGPRSRPGSPGREAGGWSSLGWRDTSIPLRVVLGNFAKQCGLLGDVVAGADDHDLSICGIEMRAPGSQHVGSGKGADALAIGFQVILRQALEIDAR